MDVAPFWNRVNELPLKDGTPGAETGSVEENEDDENKAQSAS